MKLVNGRSAPYQPYGTAKRLWQSEATEILFSGPAGTGKSRGCLEYLMWCALTYPGFRGLILRKTRSSITQSAIVTFEKHVLPVGWLGTVVRWRTQEQEYRFPNGSAIVVGGIDNPVKIMSAEYDVIYIQEAIELNEEDWESATTRLRNGKMPLQRIIADTNPSYPQHWLKQRCDRGDTEMVYCRHEDNPRLYDQVKKLWTREGQSYLKMLEKLTGVRKLRLRWGKWVQAEGQVYDGFDQKLHLVDRFDIPATWPRYWAIDFGFTNAFVWQAWAVDPDGRLYRYREIYMTQGLVEDHAKTIKEITAGEPRPMAVICDHDAEGRATFEKYSGFITTPAYKAVSEGIQATQVRLRPAGDGKPRLYLMRDSLVERDTKLTDRKLPASTDEEVDGYIWNLASNRKKGEEPVKENDHGMDTMRYMVAYLDCGKGNSRPFSMPVGGKRTVGTTSPGAIRPGFPPNQRRYFQLKLTNLFRAKWQTKPLHHNPNFLSPTRAKSTSVVVAIAG